MSNETQNTQEDSFRRRVRQNVRNYACGLTADELRNEITRSAESADTFRTECLREFLADLVDDQTERMSAVLKDWQAAEESCKRS